MKLLFFILFLLISNLKISQNALPCNNNIYCDPAYNNPVPVDVYTNNARSVIMMGIVGPGSGTCTCTLLRQLFSNNDDNQQ